VQQWLSSPGGMSMFGVTGLKSRASSRFSSEQDIVVILGSWVVDLTQQSCTRKLCVIRTIVGNEASIGGPSGGSLDDFWSGSVTHCRAGEQSIQKVLGHPYFSSMTQPGSGDNTSTARKVHGFDKVPTICSMGSPEAPEPRSLSTREVCKEPGLVR
jgi:hypothetical protein